jgi:hypothetical protein
MKLWIDDVRPAPEGYVWCKSTREALRLIVLEHKNEIELIDLDHDAGDFAKDGGDFINILNELERLSRHKNIINGVELHNYWHKRCREIQFKLHSMNPVGVENMRRIIQRNNWREV